MRWWRFVQVCICLMISWMGAGSVAVSVMIMMLVVMVMAMMMIGYFYHFATDFFSEQTNIGTNIEQFILDYSITKRQVSSLWLLGNYLPLNKWISKSKNLWLKTRTRIRFCSNFNHFFLKELWSTFNSTIMNGGF